MLKPNVSAVVGDLYPEKGARRDAGFSIFYMGINIGAFLGPLICGYLGQRVDWHLALALLASACSSASSSTGPVSSTWAMREPWRIRPPKPKRYASPMGQALPRVSAPWSASLSCSSSCAGSLGLDLQGLAQATGLVMVILAVVYFGYVIFLGGLTPRERKRVFVIFLLFIGAALFWSGFEQAGSSMNLFAERYTDWNFFGWEMPASWAQSINPLFIIIMAPVFAGLWVWLGHGSPPFR